MKRIIKILLLFILVSVIAFNVNEYSAKAYDEEKGVEWGDVVAISFVRYVYHDGVRIYGLDLKEDNFRVVVDDTMFNYNFVSKLVGMKLGETKPLISWTVTEKNGTIAKYDYHNTTIVKILKDVTPDKNLTSAGRVLLTILEVGVGIGAAIGAIYLAIFLKKKFMLGVKKCSKCGKPADVKCIKCGYIYCHDCSKKGCINCGSRKFIRLK